MAAPERRATARRSGVVPTCAAFAAALAYALATACLNPMPDDFPSNDESGSATDRGSGGSGGSANLIPAAPGLNGDGESPGEGPSTDAPEPPPPSGGAGAAGPDAGLDAGVESPETGPGDEMAP